MNKVLILGGAGYIGGLTTDVLIENGNFVTVYDNLLYENRYLKPINFIYGDIRDTDKVIELAKDFDVIIIMAAIVGDPACQVDPNLTEEINHIAVKNIVERLDNNIHVIFMSTCSVYGAQDGLLDEESETNPLSTYASTKLMSEKYVLDKRGTVIRLGTVYGLGDSYSRVRMDLVVNVLTMKAFTDGKININGGEQWRPIIAVRDIAGYLNECVKIKPEGIFVLSKENVNIAELGERVTKVVSKYRDVEVIKNNVSFQDARNYRVLTNKVDGLFTYRPIVSVEEEVNNILTLLKNKRIKDSNDILYNNGGYLKKLYGKN